MGWSVEHGGGGGLVLATEDVRLRLGPPRLELGEALVPATVKGERFRFGDVRLDLQVDAAENCDLTGTLKNRGDAPARLGRLTFPVPEVALGPGFRYRFFKNGHQSWTESRSFGPDERQRVPVMAFLNRMQDNMNNLPARAKAGGQTGGQICAELFAVLAELESSRHLLIGQRGPFAQFVYIRATFIHGAEQPPTLELVWDFGGQEIAPDTSLSLDPVSLRVGDDANLLLDGWLDDVSPLTAEQRVDPPPVPIGWCSWYYYFTRVSADDFRQNLAVARERDVDWAFFQLDDGYQSAVGDWLVLNEKYPQGLRPLVDEIEAAGMRAGIWLAPFTACANSRTFQQHPDWFLRHPNGLPFQVGWNPMWGVLGGRMYGLDTTHPKAQEYLRQVIATMVHEWGFTYLKLDFLFSETVYADAHDRSLSPAQRLQLGYDIVREAAGPDVFLLGCGAPLAPSIGKVDGMRIGPDVAPTWFPTYRYHLTRDPHALSARFSIRSMLTRAQFHRRLWENDPDCLLIRDTRTKLSATERRTLTDAIAITGGMFLLSDDLTRLPDAFWPHIKDIERVTRDCSTGRTWPLDLMHHETPELVYNTSGYVAVFNFADSPQPKRIPLATLPLNQSDGTRTTAYRSVWSPDQTYSPKDGHLDLGTLPPHGSLLLKAEGAPE